MTKRMLDCYASDFRKFTKEDLLESKLKSEGRVIACETIGTLQPMLGNVTNAEFAAAMGADILLLNMFDVMRPVIHGLPETEPENTVKLLKKLTGRPVGINLEPVEEGEEGEENEDTPFHTDSALQTLGYLWEEDSVPLCTEN